MLELPERFYFHLCRILGRLLRAGRYAQVQILSDRHAPEVRKHRLFYAPLLVWLGRPLVRILDTGVRVLPQREWEERERQIYSSVYDTSIRTGADGVLILPFLPGRTLAAVLEDPELSPSDRMRAIELAVVALTGFHQKGFTHGDAMAENVMVDLEAGVARWFDFETIHDQRRPGTWRRADDVRALLSTCLVRTPADQLAQTLRLVLDAYADAVVLRLLATTFSRVWQRPLAFHLAQAALSYRSFQQVTRSLRVV